MTRNSDLSAVFTFLSALFSVLSVTHLGKEKSVIDHVAP